MQMFDLINNHHMRTMQRFTEQSDDCSSYSKNISSSSGLVIDVLKLCTCQSINFFLWSEHMNWWICILFTNKTSRTPPIFSSCPDFHGRTRLCRMEQGFDFRCNKPSRKPRNGWLIFRQCHKNLEKTSCCTLQNYVKVNYHNLNSMPPQMAKTDKTARRWGNCTGFS